MKKQETVLRNHQKVVDQWKQSQERKINNLKNELNQVTKKKESLVSRVEFLLNEIERIQALMPPKAPTLEERQSQLKNSVSGSNRTSSDIPRSNSFQEN